MLPVLLNVEESSRAPEARNAARSMARSLGFDEASAERAAIIAMEACTNLLKHAGGGTLVLTANQELGIELLALDSGPGMANLRECLADGYSTAGTAGNGLGAIRRLAAFSDAYSQPGRGTVVFAMIVNQQMAGSPPPRVCGLQAPKPGQEVCGDAWGCKLGDSRSTVVVADGLGHGPDAAAAARAAMEIFTTVRRPARRRCWNRSIWVCGIPAARRCRSQALTRSGGRWNSRAWGTWLVLSVNAAAFAVNW